MTTEYDKVEEVLVKALQVADDSFTVLRELSGSKNRADEFIADVIKRHGLQNKYLCGLLYAYWQPISRGYWTQTGIMP